MSIDKILNSSISLQSVLSKREKQIELAWKRRDVEKTILKHLEETILWNAWESLS
jgi:hypothetical protein